MCREYSDSKESEMCLETEMPGKGRLTIDGAGINLACNAVYYRVLLSINHGFIAF